MRRAIVSPDVACFTFSHRNNRSAANRKAKELRKQKVEEHKRKMKNAEKAPLKALKEIEHPVKDVVAEETAPVVESKSSEVKEVAPPEPMQEAPDEDDTPESAPEPEKPVDPSPESSSSPESDNDEEDPTMAKEDTSVKKIVSDEISTVSAPQGATLEAREQTESPQTNEESRETPGTANPSGLLCGCI